MHRAVPWLLLFAALASRSASAQLSSEGTFGVANAYGTSDSAAVTSTPGPGGLSVSVGGTATRSGELNLQLWQEDYEWEAIVVGDGEVDYGFATASLSLTARSTPQLVYATELNAGNGPLLNTGNAFARSIVALEFDDVVEVTSATLPLGTPVSIEFHFAIDSTDVSVGLGQDSYIGSTFQGTVGSLSVGVSDLVRLVLGKQVTSATFDTAVGHTLRIEGKLLASGEAHAGYRPCCVYNTEVEATTTARSAGLWATPPEGVELVAESGADYTVPEPGAFASGVAALLALATFMNSRRWFASGSRSDGPATSTARSHSMPCAARKRAA